MIIGLIQGRQCRHLPRRMQVRVQVTTTSSTHVDHTDIVRVSVGQQKPQLPAVSTSIRRRVLRPSRVPASSSSLPLVPSESTATPNLNVVPPPGSPGTLGPPVNATGSVQKPKRKRSGTNHKILCPGLQNRNEDEVQQRLEFVSISSNPPSAADCIAWNWATIALVAANALAWFPVRSNQAAGFSTNCRNVIVDSAGHLERSKSGHLPRKPSDRRYSSRVSSTDGDSLAEARVICTNRGGGGD